MDRSTVASIQVDGSSGSEDDLRALHGWLTGDGDLRVRMVESPPRPGEMGAVTDSIAVVLAPGGVAAVLAGSLVSWLRRRRSDLTVRLHRADGAELEVSVTQLRGLEAGQLSDAVSSLSGWLEREGP